MEFLKSGNENKLECKQEKINLLVLSVTNLLRRVYLALQSSLINYR